MTSADLAGRDGSLDEAAFWLVRFVADTKFITLFSLLFGAGLALLRGRTLAKDEPFAPVAARRLLALFAFGVLHGSLLWFGDILTHYALLGFVALLLAGLRPATLVVIAAILLSVSFAADVLARALDAGFLDRGVDPSIAPLAREEAIRNWSEVFASGDFRRMAAARFPLYAFGQALILAFWGFRTLGLFLLGIAAVRSGLLDSIRERPKFLAGIAAGGLVLGAAVSSLLWLAHPADGPATAAIHGAALHVSAYFLSPAWFALLALWLRSGRAAGLLRAFEATGRMAFTNYILQSLIAAVIFNYAGLYDRLGRFAGLLVVVPIFAFQLWFSPFWLARFRYGPLEWIWRSITYARLQPFSARR